jgi:hypothetical protein
VDLVGKELTMQALLVVESCFGCTLAVARAVADGLRDAGTAVEIVPAAQAPATVDADLVLVGAPTHNMGLPSSTSRASAAQKGAPAAGNGVREWLERWTPGGARVVSFDTGTGGFLAGSAAKAVVKALRRRGTPCERGESFTVSGTAGPLADGELERARAWGRSLAQR